MLLGTAGCQKSHGTEVLGDTRKHLGNRSMNFRRPFCTDPFPSCFTSWCSRVPHRVGWNEAPASAYSDFSFQSRDDRHS